MNLGWLVWDKMERGRLFVLPDSQIWAGPATGKQCVVCEQRIQDGNEYEVAGPTDGSVFAHPLLQGLGARVTGPAREARRHPRSVSGSAHLA
jgi:hypothetical protein